jgi:hypothetical protein
VTFVESVFPFRSSLSETDPIDRSHDDDPPPATHIDPAAWPVAHPPTGSAPPGSPVSPSGRASSAGHDPSPVPSPSRSPPVDSAASSASSISSSPSPAPTNQHQMVTRAKLGIRKPNPKYASIATTSVSPIPTSVREALRDPHWRAAMNDEIAAITSNNTWTLVPRPPQTNVVTGK